MVPESLPSTVAASGVSCLLQEEYEGLVNLLSNRNKERAAVMTISSIKYAEEDDMDLSSDATPVLQLQLYRADVLTSVAEVDQNLKVIRLEPEVGLIFGKPVKTMMNRSINKYVLWAVALPFA